MALFEALDAAGTFLGAEDVFARVAVGPPWRAKAFAFDRQDRVEDRAALTFDDERSAAGPRRQVYRPARVRFVARSGFGSKLLSVSSACSLLTSLIRVFCAACVLERSCLQTCGSSQSVPLYKRSACHHGCDALPLQSCMQRPEFRRGAARPCPAARSPACEHSETTARVLRSCDRRAARRPSFRGVCAVPRTLHCSRGCRILKTKACVCIAVAHHGDFGTRAVSRTDAGSTSDNLCLMCASA
jgi:hypothetical protein